VAKAPGKSDRKGRKGRSAAAELAPAAGWRRAGPLVAAGAILAIYLLLSVLLVWDYGPVDDAFITFRYAHHLAEGKGLTFNPGDRVEGYSSLSWTLGLALGDALGLDLPDLSRALGLVLGAGTLLLLLLASWAGPRARYVAAGLFAVWLPGAYHFLNGLETALAAFLVTALVAVPASTPKRRLAHHAAGAVLVLTRPEGFLAVLLWALSSWLSDRRSRPRHEAGVALTAAVFFLGQTAFRWLYHGDWIANSARAKLLPLALTLPKGLADLGRFAFEGAGYSTLALLALAAFFLGRTLRELRAGCWFLALFGAALASSGGDSFPLWRFYVPLAPVLFLCAAQGLDLWLGGRKTAAPRRTSSRRASLALAAAALLVALCLPYGGFLLGMKREAAWRDQWIAIGKSLAAHMPPGTTIALCPVGALPFYSKLPTLDMLGLNDRHIARVRPDRRYYYPGHHRHDAGYILSRQPDLILLANGPVVPQPMGFAWPAVRPYERDFTYHPRFRTEYRLIHVPLEPRYFVQLFARREFLEKSGDLPGVL
jgi:arabinofuranosyltransferase